MGFERSGASLLLKMKEDGVPFGRVLTLGRQNAFLHLGDYNRILKRVGRSPVEVVPEFADDLLLAMGATQVDALDFSPYDGAAYVHDLNTPIPPEWRGQFDMVFDGGTLEHVFNFPVAIRNCMELLKPNGRFVSVTIPNNWCGHGFYQFSPELFFRVFNPANGFSTIEMYMTTLTGRAYAVADPEAVRSRVELCNGSPVFLLVHARRDEVKELFSETPHQCDYMAVWTNTAHQSSYRVPPPWKNHPLIQPFRNFITYVRTRLALRQSSLSNRKFYRRVDLSI